MIEIDPTAQVSKFADIEDSVRGTRIVIGARAVVDSFVKIKPAGGSGDVTIGEGSYINSGTVIYSGNGVTIGKGVLVAANCTFAAANHAFARVDVPTRPGLPAKPRRHHHRGRCLDRREQRILMVLSSARAR